jgi:hypothetical protein
MISLLISTRFTRLLLIIRFFIDENGINGLLILRSQSLTVVFSAYSRKAEWRVSSR